MVAEFAARRDLIVTGLNAITGVKCGPVEGAFYVFPDASAFGRSAEVAKLLLQECGAAMIPGSAFGGDCDGHLRLSSAASREKLKRGLEAMRAVLESQPVLGE